jgi:transcriptional regulator of NAD metabolism
MTVLKLSGKMRTVLMDDSYLIEDDRHYVKAGNKHYMVYKQWVGYEVDIQGNQIGDTEYSDTKKQLLENLK